MPSPDNLKAREPYIDAPEEHWREIEASIGLKKPSPLFRCRLSQHVELALEPDGPPSFGEVGGPHVSEVRKRLRKLNNDAKRLAATLAELQGHAESGNRDADRALYLTVNRWSTLLQKEYPDLWRAIARSDPYRDFPEELKSELQDRLSLTRFYDETETLAVTAVTHLAAASEAAMLSLPKSKGGAPKDTDLDELICTLALIYREETGNTPSVTWDEHKERFSGRFFEFVAACCEAFAPKYMGRSNQALGKAIQRALKELPVSL